VLKATCRLDLPGPRPGPCCGERGLLSIAFHRATLKRLFFRQLHGRQRRPVVARYRVSSNPDRADPASAPDHSQGRTAYANHNGACSCSAPTAISTRHGRRRVGGVPGNRAQIWGTFLQMLRIRRLTARPPMRFAEYPFLKKPRRVPKSGLRASKSVAFQFDRRTGPLHCRARPGQVGRKSISARIEQGRRKLRLELWREATASPPAKLQSGRPVLRLSNTTTRSGAPLRRLYLRGEKIPGTSRHIPLRDYSSGCSRLGARRLDGGKWNPATPWSPYRITTYGEIARGNHFRLRGARGIFK